ncbi:MAG: hypothetical protein P4L53_26585 [Candidatus Obscuribacterales bacterium]|nr:hypothetical protein [Candidatus Obscuribacterales bacterium]
MKIHYIAILILALLSTQNQRAFASFDETDLQYLSGHQDADVLAKPSEKVDILVPSKSAASIEPLRRGQFVQYLGVPIKPQVTGLTATAHHLTEPLRTKQNVAAKSHAELKVEANLLNKPATTRGEN